MPLTSTNLPLPERHEGKVRDSYPLGAKRLIVATDRLSIFDVVLPDAVEHKGAVLTKVSAFWFQFAEKLGIPHHLLTADHKEIFRQYPDLAVWESVLKNRSMLVKTLNMVPGEFIVRGNLTGSGWTDYKNTGKVCGHDLPPGLIEHQQLPTPLFTPSTKAEKGKHDQNVSVDEITAIVDAQFPGRGQAIIDYIRKVSLLLFTKAREHAMRRGIILADTKFEYGVDPETDLIVLADEALTPDSSRYWELKTFAPPATPKSWDKQIVRNHAAVTMGWNKKPPAPHMPQEVLDLTSMRYIEANDLLTDEPYNATA